MGKCSLPKSIPIIYQFIVPSTREKNMQQQWKLHLLYNTFHFILTGRDHRAHCTDTASRRPSIIIINSHRYPRRFHEVWPALSSSFKDHNHGDWIWKIRLVTNQVLVRHSPAYLASYGATLMSLTLLLSDTLKVSSGLLVHPAKPLLFCLFKLIYLFLKCFHFVFIHSDLFMWFDLFRIIFLIAANVFQKVSLEDFGS